MAATEEEHYHPKDAIHAGLHGGLTMGGVGLLFAAVRNSLAKRDIGPWAVFTRNGGLIVTFGVFRSPRPSLDSLLTRHEQLPSAVPTSSAVWPLRTCARRTTSITKALLASSLAQFLVLEVGTMLLQTTTPRAVALLTTASTTAGRIPRILGYGLFTGITMAAFEFTGGSLRGYWNAPKVDEYERKEMLRKNRRRPIEETLAEIGEGRGEFVLAVASLVPCGDPLGYHDLPASRYPAARIRGTKAAEN